MRFFQAVVLGASAFASVALAQLKITEAPLSVEAGKSYPVTYQASSLSSPVEFVLRKGVEQHSDIIRSLGSATGGNFTWVVANSLENGNDYALMVKQGDATNYWGPITLTGGKAAAISSAKASSASSAVSSLESAISSLNSSLASATASTTGATTLRSASATATSTRTTGAASSTGSAASAPTNGAAGLSSPMALIFGAVAAMAYLN